MPLIAILKKSYITADTRSSHIIHTLHFGCSKKYTSATINQTQEKKKQIRNSDHRIDPKTEWFYHQSLHKHVSNVFCMNLCVWHMEKHGNSVDYLVQCLWCVRVGIRKCRLICMAKKKLCVVTAACRGCGGFFRIELICIFVTYAEYAIATLTMCILYDSPQISTFTRRSVNQSNRYLSQLLILIGLVALRLGLCACVDNKHGGCEHTDQNNGKTFRLRHTFHIHLTK